jgi:hypothetical protein
MTYYPGKWKAICDVCGFQYMNDELMDRWDGYKVCKKDWEPRHPQDFVRSYPERITPPWTRPPQPDVFVGPTYILGETYWGEYTTVPNDEVPSTWYAQP